MARQAYLSSSRNLGSEVQKLVARHDSRAITQAEFVAVTARAVA
jgi:hypothetical protein